ncbi:Peroxidase, family 2 [Rhizoctonia solani]|uniref:Peroxidase, family 2 n=1 Tax=Rhizoctonia solani TaxID=456999 RepID=A0A8H7I251_9AGAM|nr:Peroxidase, family 2 [Rhizoctonia solani]
MDAAPGHEFQPPTPQDSRSPCPALNAAANHNYLPRSGKGLGLFQLCKAVHNLYGLTYLVAAIPTVLGILSCGSGGRVDLEQLAKHGKLEHDASLSRLDHADGDNKNVCPWLVDQLIAQSTDGRRLSMRDFAKARVLRESQVPRTLPPRHVRIAQSESVMSVIVIGNGQHVDCKVVREWFGNERLPSGWAPRRSVGLFEMMSEMRKFGRLMDDVKQENHDKDA